jgi:CheY-like chemotaxis protein
MGDLGGDVGWEEQATVRQTTLVRDMYGGVLLLERGVRHPFTFLSLDSAILRILRIGPLNPARSPQQGDRLLKGPSLCRLREKRRSHMNVTGPQLLTITILVVDDNDAVRHVIARTLEQEGYIVLTAADGEQALTVVEQPGIEVDLVVCDLVMPRLDGYQLASRLAELPNAPEVLFITAFRSDLEFGRLPVLTKPFQLRDLTTAVQRILQKRAEPVREAVPA